MKAIDLYSGAGGWSLGLRMAGIEVIRSYEWWDCAARTHRANLGSRVDEVDIRQLDPRNVPEADIVVGSPPCTEFSFANRGGNGDIAEGLRDIAKFLEIVEHLQPAYWAMENVPRVAGILRREIQPGGLLRRYADLVDVIEVVNMASLGLPQKRRRMIAGRYPLELLEAYTERLPNRTFGGVLERLSDAPVRDPIYDLKLTREELTEQEPEAPLNDEEERMNREAKTYHPVYNKMSFPDELERPSRTVTAVCTRVSRESIVIEAPERPGCYRRLTLRERASLQGFPITYQFFGGAYTDKLKLIGNALPPLAAYYIGHAMLGTEPGDLGASGSILCDHSQPPDRPDETPPPGLSNRHRRNRKFRAALPHLRFGSGMRVELANSARKDNPSWRTAFYYGNSKKYETVELTDELLATALDALPSDTSNEVRKAITDRHDSWSAHSGADIQRRWTHRAEESVHPFELADDLGATAKSIRAIINVVSLDQILDIIFELVPNVRDGQRPKFRDHGHWIMAGLIVGAAFNASRAE
ncbi:MAG: DNA cytosine methyltransferase [Actinomycetota bacterium]|nr:DNA cytosine methyltransferase [Actinomycetota bacterium]